MSGTSREQDNRACSYQQLINTNTANRARRQAPLSRDEFRKLLDNELKKAKGAMGVSKKDDADATNSTIEEQLDILWEKIDEIRRKKTPEFYKKRDIKDAIEIVQLVSDSKLVIIEAEENGGRLPKILGKMQLITDLSRELLEQEVGV